VSVNPLIVKQLLQVQTLKQLDFFSDDSPGTAGGADGFAALLSALLAEASVPAGAIQVRHSSSPVWPPSVLPNAAGANAGDYDQLIRSAAVRHQVEPSLIKAVIAAESSFRPDAVSPSGAKGLMQLMDSTSLDMGVTDPFDPEQNINGGARYLAGLLQKYQGETGVALAAYNAGPGTIDRLGIRTDADLRGSYQRLPKETQSYVRKVLSLQSRYTVQG
jgi:soluble lytic murein transglycosylase-like protein